MDVRNVMVRTARLREESAWSGLLAPAESLRSREISDPSARARFVVSRGLRRHLLGACTGVGGGDLEFREPPGEKPRLACAAGWDFNISHAGDVVAVAAGRGHVGVDVERIRPVREMAAIVQRYFHPDEARVWKSLAEGAREEGFFVLWSAREAAMKCAGLGLAKGMAVTRVEPEILVSGAAGATAGNLSVQLLRRECGDGYVMMVAAGEARGICTLRTMGILR